MRFLTFEEELTIDKEAIEKMHEIYPHLTKEEIRKIAVGSSYFLNSNERELRQQFGGIWREISLRVLGK